MRLGFYPQTIRMGRAGAGPDPVVSAKVIDISSPRPQGRRAGPAPRAGLSCPHDDSQQAACRLNLKH
jgi:hypothetical protein